MLLIISVSQWTLWRRDGSISNRNRWLSDLNNDSKRRGRLAAEPTHITFDSGRVGEAAGHLHTLTNTHLGISASAVAPITQQISLWQSLL